MRRVVVSEFVTLDGVTEDPGGAEGFERGGWAFQFDRGPEGDKFKVDEVMASDALLLGQGDLRGLRGGVAVEDGRVRRQVQRCQSTSSQRRSKTLSGRTRL